MHVIISNAWVRDEPGAAEGYQRVYEDFGELHAAQPGFIDRQLVRDEADPTHFVNLRWFQHADDYAGLVAHPDYGSWIARLSEFVEPRDPQKITAEVVLT